MATSRLGDGGTGAAVARDGAGRGIDRGVRALWAAALVAGWLAGCTPPMPAPVSERVDVSSAEAAADGPCCSNDGVVGQSADGRYVLFNSLATNLVPGDTNGAPPPSFAGRDVFVRDRVAGMTLRASVLPGGGQISSFDGLNTSVANPGISPNGRWVVFTKRNPGVDPDRIYRFDVQSGTSSLLYELSSVDPAPSTNFVEVANSGTLIAYEAGGRARVLDAVAGTISDVGPSVSTPPRLSADGRYVAVDAYVHDRVTASDESLVSGAPAADAVVAMSDDARFVLFRSDRVGLTADDVSAADDLFVKDRSNGTYRLASGGSGSAGMEPTAGWTQQRIVFGPFTIDAHYPLAAVSNDGARVAFATDAAAVGLPSSVAGEWNTYVRDLGTGATRNLTAVATSHARWASWGGDVLSGNGARVVGSATFAGVTGLWSVPAG